MAAQISTAPNAPVKQFSVFAENRLGRVHDLVSVLKEHDVHVMGMTMLDTTDSAIVRFVVVSSLFCSRGDQLSNYLISIS